MSVVDIKVPVIGESISEVTISAFLKESGEFVEKDESICEIESDKATLEMPAEVSGTLTWLIEEGDDVEIGVIVARIDTSAGANTSSNTPKEETPVVEVPQTETKNDAPVKGEIIELAVPVIGESISEVTISAFLKENGDVVEKDESICEIESDKATLEMPAEAAGTLTWVIEEGDDVEIGAVIATIDTAGASGSSSTSTPVVAVESKSSAPVSSKETYATGHPSPAAAKLMAENNLTSSNIKGTGKDGRILKEDVEKAIIAKASAPKAQAPVQKSAPKKEAKTVAAPAAATGNRGTERKKMSRMRRTIARRLLEAKHSTAMLTTFNEVDLTEVMAMRKQYQERFVAKYGVKLGFMSLFTKACAKTLMEMPDVNAVMDGNELIYHNYADISIAVSTKTGLVVPVIRNAEAMNFAEIENEIKALAVKARDGKLGMDEMSGGTFSITNGGVFGSMMSTPILNPPQSAILGMHNILDRAMVVNGEIKVRKMMYLALSYDHRVVDGKGAVTFLSKVKALLEDPVTLLLDL